MFKIMELQTEQRELNIYDYYEMLKQSQFINDYTCTNISTYM